MQSQSLPVLIFALALVALTTATATTFEAAIPRNTLPLETVSPPSDGDATPTSTPIPSRNSTPIPNPASTVAPAATNASRDIGLDRISGVITCSTMNLQPAWGEIDFACERNEAPHGKTLIFIRHDKTILYECSCNKGLESYSNNWGLQWWGARSDDDKSVFCYTRRRIFLWQYPLRMIKSVKCDDRVKYCDMRSYKPCTYV